PSQADEPFQPQQVTELVPLSEETLTLTALVFTVATPAGITPEVAEVSPAGQVFATFLSAEEPAGEERESGDGGDNRFTAPGAGPAAAAPRLLHRSAARGGRRSSVCPA